MANLKEKIKDQNPIEEVIWEFIEIDKNHKALCPFHKEDTPSFSINTKNQYFYCFGCGSGGDVFSFMMKHKNLSFVEAMKYLADRKGIDFEISDFNIEQEEKIRSIYETLKQATDAYHKNLPAEIKAYLNNRGLTDETIKKYKLGFCSNKIKLSIEKNALLEAGLIYENGNQYFDGFITFPNLHDGKIVYVSGRGYPEKKHKKLHKENVVLEHLYNEQAVYNKKVIIAEGEIDTLTLLQNGFNACGVLGVQSFKDEWLEKFNSCETVYIAFDGDAAGRTASLKLATMIGSKARIVLLPDGKDVNDFFRTNTTEDFQKLIDTAESLIEFKIKSIDPSIAKTKLPQELEPILKDLATLNIAEGDAILKHTIKNHFSLTTEDIKSYEKQLKVFRKDESTEEKLPLSQKDILNIIETEQNTTIVHPMQDYCDGKMNFGIKIKDDSFIITSDRKIFNISSAKENNYSLKNNHFDFSRFSSNGLKRFLEQDEDIKIQEIYSKIYDYIKRFICFPAPCYLTYITLWIMGTYIFMIFRYYPYVWLNAEKGSGKTLLMEILSVIAFNGELITNPTESVIFRDISSNLITMFIDEVEQFRKRDKDTYSSLISLLNSGFNKAGLVKRSECNGKTYSVKAYSAYSPKMFAGINEIDDVLQDRTIRIPILRKKDYESVERYKETSEIVSLQKSIRDDLYIFALRYANQIATMYQRTEENAIEGMEHLNNRELDIWEPIFLLANIVDALNNSAELTDMMENFSKESVKEKLADSVSQNETYKVLNVVKNMFDDLASIATQVGDIYVYDAQAVLEYFKKTEDFDWINKTNLLTRKLKKIKVLSEQKRIDGYKKRVYNIKKTEFFDLCERFKI